MKQNRGAFVMMVLAALALPAAWAADPASAFVRVSPRDARYLELTDGTPYIPIGLNMISPPRVKAGEAEALRGMESWLESLSSNGGNYIRVWVSNPFWDIENEKSGVYDQAQARRIDRLLELCEQHGIRVKLTLEHFRSIGGGSQKWADKPLHHVSNGGPAQSIADFFDGEASRAQFRQKIRWYGERYGPRPIIYGWELWNEVNAVRGGDYMTWTGLMLAELHKTFPQNGEKPEVLRGLSVDLRPALGGRNPRRVRVYDPWPGNWSNGKMRRGILQLPPFSRSIVIQAM
jgi:hypothetical protein